MSAIKSALKRLSLARYAYERVQTWREKEESKRLFENYDLYLAALRQKGEGTVVLRTHDGLELTIRRNIWDARIIREIFFERPYVRHITLPPNPVIVDIGGYIGDFSVYAVKHLGAERVVVYEPTQENFKLLQQNIEINRLADRITAVNKAVSDSHEVMLNVRIQANDEIHVSSYWYQGAERRRTQSVTLQELFEEHQLEHVDLLKVDCEGGEYDIFPSLPDRVLDRIGSIVFEYHRVDGYEEKLDLVLDRLRSAGYALARDGKIVSASRDRVRSGAGRGRVPEDDARFER
ncbi:MAG: FkbM family methyltransferase [Thermoanaerobaculia bacterium]|nr:FkbM family methyltransferase [Thermoanaerobaculia bacterium]